MDSGSSFKRLLNTSENSFDQKKVITSQSDLAQLRPAFKRLLVDLVGSTAAAKVCPAELDKEIVLFCTPDQAGKDLHTSQIELLKRAYPEVKTFRTIEISPVMLLTLSREGGDSKWINASRGTRGRDSSDVSIAFRDIVSWSIRQGASDIELNIDNDSVYSQVHVHIDGHYIAPESLRMPTARLREIVKVAWLDVIGGSEPAFDERKEDQGRLYEVIDDISYMLRWGTFIADRGPSITLRALNLNETLDGLTLEALGYLPSHISMFDRAQCSEGGAVFLGGVVGNGKSTTIARLMTQLPSNRKKMTLEDPVERYIRGALSASIVRDLNFTDTNAFRRKLMMLKRSAVRDVLIGEIRDIETGQAFQDVMESGSNVYTTGHSYSMLAIPERLASRQIGVPITLLASPGMLKLLAYQALLPKLCEKCALPISQLKAGFSDALGHVQSDSYWNEYVGCLNRLYSDLDGVHIRNPQGCEHCRAKGIPDLYGYKGRTVVAELFELGHNLDALRCVRAHDVIGLQEVYESLSDKNARSENMEGKTAMECAVYKMLMGQIDPRDVEPRFMAFKTLELKKNGKRAR